MSRGENPVEPGGVATTRWDQRRQATAPRRAVGDPRGATGWIGFAEPVLDATIGTNRDAVGRDDRPQDVAREAFESGPVGGVEVAMDVRELGSDDRGCAASARAIAAHAVATEQFPVMVRPSYVLGGRAMRRERAALVWLDDGRRAALAAAARAASRRSESRRGERLPPSGGSPRTRAFTFIHPNPRFLAEPRRALLRPADRARPSPRLSALVARRADLELTGWADEVKWKRAIDLVRRRNPGLRALLKRRAPAPVAKETVARGGISRAELERRLRPHVDAPFTLSRQATAMHGWEQPPKALLFIWSEASDDVRNRVAKSLRKLLGPKDTNLVIIGFTGDDKLGAKTSLAEVNVRLPHVVLYCDLDYCTASATPVEHIVLPLSSNWCGRLASSIEALIG